MNGTRAEHAAHNGAERLGVFTGMLPGASKPIRNVNRQFVNRGVAGRCKQGLGYLSDEVPS